MFSRLLSTMTATIVCTGSIFAAANPSKTELSKYVYRIKGQDGKKIKLFGGTSERNGDAVLSTFDCVINDAGAPGLDAETSFTDICSRSEPFFYFYNNGSLFYHQHASATIRKEHIQNISARWLLLSAATSPIAHAQLGALAGNALEVSAQDAAKKLKGNSTSCVVINIEAFKNMIAGQITESQVIDIPMVSVDFNPATSEPLQPPISGGRGFGNPCPLL